jgi:flagellar biosynthesis/type III secretory pathway M-ring protein FliF/YscJ
MTPRSPEELVKLRHVVESAIGIDSTPQSTRGDQVTLEELPFNDQFAAGVTQELDQQQKHQAWWDMARSAVYPAFALGALIALFVIFKRTPIQEIPLGVPVGRLVAHKGPAAGNGDWSRGAQPGVVSVEVLNRLVKENPTNMTQALREWLNKSRSES